MWIEVGITGVGERHEEGSRGGTGVGIEMRRGLNGRMDLGLGMGFRLGLGLGLSRIKYKIRQLWFLSLEW